jgi:uncharacterized membrane protein YgdD (TMEM256/DUF423 family)
MKKKIIITAASFGVFAVIAGAFGAHGLQGEVTPKNLAIWQTGVQYEFYHTFALLFVSTLSRYNIRILKHCYYLFFIGIILFSGSLYLLACNDLIDVTWLPGIVGPITPIGGLFLIAGWVTLGVAALKIKKV